MTLPPKVQPAHLPIAERHARYLDAGYGRIMEVQCFSEDGTSWWVPATCCDPEDRYHQWKVLAPAYPEDVPDMAKHLLELRPDNWFTATVVIPYDNDRYRIYFGPRQEW